MDPATIIGTTSAVLSFVDFTGQIISTAIEIRRGGKEATNDKRSFEQVVQDFSAKLSALRPQSTIGPHGASLAGPQVDKDAEEALQNAVTRCEGLGASISKILSKATARPRDEQSKPLGSLRKALGKIGGRGAARDKGPSLVQVIRASVVTVWKAEEIEALRTKWEFCITAVNDALFRLETSKNFGILMQVSQETSNHLRILRNLVEQLIHESQRANLDSLQSFLGDYRDANSTSNREKRNQTAILDALVFPGMESRQRNMSDAVGDTFKWCTTEDSIPEDHPELNISFSKWLCTGNGVYHFTGKPGSGKSTLMKFIEKSPETEDQLQAWARADHRSLLRASFFVWKIADAHPLQNRFDGLVRSLLHQILTQVPEHIRRVFPDCWRPQNFGALNSDAPQFKLESDMGALREVLRTLLSTRLVGQAKIFLLIDGLDEFNDTQTHSEIAREIRSWCANNNNIKICVASREDNAFLNTFSPYQRLRLHLVTRKDVMELASRRLWEHPYFSTYPKAGCDQLIDDIVQTAEGVFLWVVLIIGQMLQLLDDSQDLEDLRNVVKTHSKELDEFLKEIIGQIPESYRHEAAAVFAVTTVVHAARYISDDHLSALEFTLLEASTIRDCVATHATTSEPFQYSAMDIDQALAQVKRFKSRLPTLCKGLLTTVRDPFHETKDDVRMDLGLLPSLVFVHRSVYDLFEHGNLKLFGIDCNTTLVKHGRVLLWQSLARAAQIIPLRDDFFWAKWDFGLRAALIYLDLSRDAEPITHGEMCVLEVLETSLVRGQRLCFWERDQTKDHEISGDLPCPVGLTKHIVSVLGTAVCEKTQWYLAWARCRPYYEWLGRHVEWRRHILEKCFVHVDTSLSSVRALVEAGWVSVHDILEAGYFGGRTSFKGTVLSHAVVVLLISLQISHINHSLQQCRNRLKEFYWILTRYGTMDVKDIQFCWWSRPKQSLLRGKTNRMLSLGGLGTDFWLKMITADNEDGQRIQRPLWIRDPQAKTIMYFISIFGTASGNASLKDVLEQHLRIVADAFERQVGQTQTLNQEIRDGKNSEHPRLKIPEGIQRQKQLDEDARDIDECKKLIQAIVSHGEAERLPVVEEAHEKQDFEINGSEDAVTVSGTNVSTDKTLNKILEAAWKKQRTNLFGMDFPTVFLSGVGCLFVAAASLFITWCPWHYMDGGAQAQHSEL